MALEISTADMLENRKWKFSFLKSFQFDVEYRPRLVNASAQLTSPEFVRNSVTEHESPTEELPRKDISCTRRKEYVETDDPTFQDR